MVLVENSNLTKSLLFKKKKTNSCSGHWSVACSCSWLHQTATHITLKITFLLENVPSNIKNLKKLNGTLRPKQNGEGMDADAVQWIHFIFRVSLYYFFGFQVHVTNMIRRVFVPVLVLYPA